METNNFEWTSFYIEFANKLLLYKNDRKTLINIMHDIYSSVKMKYPFMDNEEIIDDVCPFSVFGCFNKGITIENRINFMKEIRLRFGVESKIPFKFDGIPVLNNMKAWYFRDNSEREPEDIPNLWDVFESALSYADNSSEINKSRFINSFNKILFQHGIKWNITIGLYWIRPFTYLNLDAQNRNYLLSKNNLFAEEITNVSKLKQLPDAEAYLKLILICNKNFIKPDILFHSFPELSYYSWKTQTELIDPIIDEQIKNVIHYWIYSPGEGSGMWNEFYDMGIIGISWDEMLDLKQYITKHNMKLKMQTLYGGDYSYSNSALATWQFANEMKIGDIVFVKKGIHKVIGRGIVESDYIFDETRNKYKHIRKVKWTDRAEKDHPGPAITKTLTDITPYTDYVKKLEDLFIHEERVIPEPKLFIYTDADFLNEVFMDIAQYETLVNLLKIKKNTILQGAPGVGKTYAAKRLAYSIIGELDTTRVTMVQFHQSYSYEDFIMGFRPTKDGFELNEGPFYEFCKKAQDDNEQKYFFIIDEINRGNLSKIFGELLMLIENDKRGEQLRLLYSNELFSVPKNVYIIGIMNTADRSLAMIDYALRRRFAFFDMEPAFDSEGFKNILSSADNRKFNSLITQIKILNNCICKDEALGGGFRIGHSYFCPHFNEEVTDEWLESVVKYEIIPLLNEYWFDEHSKIEQWTKKLYGVLND